MNMEEQSLSRYVDTSEEELLKATKEENVLNEWNGEIDTQHKHRLRQDHRMKKPLRGQFTRQMREVADSRS